MHESSLTCRVKHTRKAAGLSCEILSDLGRLVVRVWLSLCEIVRSPGGPIRSVPGTGQVPPA